MTGNFTSLETACLPSKLPRDYRDTQSHDGTRFIFYIALEYIFTQLSQGLFQRFDLFVQFINSINFSIPIQQRRLYLTLQVFSAYCIAGSENLSADKSRILQRLAFENMPVFNQFMLVLLKLSQCAQKFFSSHTRNSTILRSHQFLQKLRYVFRQVRLSTAWTPNLVLQSILVAALPQETVEILTSRKRDGMGMQDKIYILTSSTGLERESINESRITNQGVFLVRQIRKSQIISSVEKKV